MTGVVRPWWGSTPFDEGTARRWRIGFLELKAELRRHEWRLAHSLGEVRHDADGSPESVSSLPDDEPNLERYVAEEPGEALSFSPMVADRPIISSPRVPLWVGAGEVVVLYVGSPLWVRLSAAPGGVFLREFPLHRISDTWFGPSTQVGELCYATETRAVVDPENVSRQALWAITPVQIENRSAEALRVERLRLGVPYLSLYEEGDGTLRTDKVTMVRSEDTGMAGVEIVPASAEQRARRVSAPRSALDDGFLPRALSFLHRLGGGSDD